MERLRRLEEVTKEHKDVQMHEIRHKDYLPAINALYEEKILGQYTMKLEGTDFIGGILLMPNKEVSLNEEF